MTQDEIIELAKQAGFPTDYNDKRLLHAKEIEAFAKLVAEKEREQESDVLTIAYMSGFYDGKKAQPKVEQEPVAWRWIPSEVWGTYVLSDDLEKAELAKEHGIKIEPLYTHPQPNYQKGQTD
jgi:hypothetical protein